MNQQSKFTTQDHIYRNYLTVDQHHFNINSPMNQRTEVVPLFPGI